jgi:hypothetical protein
VLGVPSVTDAGDTGAVVLKIGVPTCGPGAHVDLVHPDGNVVDESQSAEKTNRFNLFRRAGNRGERAALRAGGRTPNVIGHEREAEESDVASARRISNDAVSITSSRGSGDGIVQAVPMGFGGGNVGPSPS